MTEPTPFDPRNSGEAIVDPQTGQVTGYRALLPFDTFPDQPRVNQIQLPSAEAVVASARRILQALPHSHELESQALFPDRLAPVNELRRPFLDYYWARHLDVSERHLAYTSPEGLKYLAKALYDNPSLDWQEHVQQLRSHWRSRVKHLIGRFMPGQDREFELAQAAADLSRAQLQSTIVELTLPTWITRTGKSDNLIDRTFQLPLTAVARSFDALSDDGKSNLDHEPTTRRVGDTQVAGNLYRLAFTLDHAQSRDWAHRAQGCDDGQSFPCDPRQFLSEQPAPLVLDRLYSAINAEGIEVDDG